MRRFLLFLIIVAVVAGGTSGCIPPPGEGSIHFQDPALENLIRETLGLGQGEIVLEDLLSITNLDAWGRNIQTLEGIEKLRNLEYLNLRDNQVEDVLPLAGLVRLRELDLRNNLVSDLSPLGRLFSLVDLDLRANLIEDIKAVGGLVRLRKLNLRDNKISDIGPLSNLVLLRELNIRGNQILDLGALGSLYALEDLNCRNNYIVSIEPLGGLANLTQRLYLGGNPIKDYRPLEDIYASIADKDFIVILGFSQGGGFYPNTVTVEIYSFIDQGVIYYTLDGSEPDPVTNGHRTHKYDKPLQIAQRLEPNKLSIIQTTFHHWQGPPRGPVFMATPVRARLFVQDQPMGHSVAQSFFVGPDALGKYSLPVISLTTNDENLFDSKTGIYVPGDRYREENVRTGNYFARGKNWERLGHMEFYETDGSLAFSQEIGIRINGGITRAWPQKSLRLYARSEYGQSTFQYPVFPDLEQDSFKRLLLRSSGNDMRLTFFRDALAQSLLVDTTKLDLQAYRPVIVFLNGEYWGIHNLRERMDNHYLAGKYGLERDQVVILGVDGTISDGSPGDGRHYRDMLSYLRSNDITDPEVYAAMSTMMDMENFIDYQVAQIYLGNTDWPFNNIQLWRLKTDGYKPDAPYGHDGRWRWMVYDTDYGLGLAEPPDYNTLVWATAADVPGTMLLRTLLNNPQFKVQFINRFAHHLNTSFAPERVLGAIEQMKAVLEPEMAEHIHRWPYISSLRAWERNINVVRDFALRRPQFVREHISQMFGIPGTAVLTVTVSSPAQGGTVQINSIEYQLPFKGIYFQEIPIEVMALPAAGYQSAGWSGDLQAETPVLSWFPKGDITIEALFIPLPEDVN